VENRVANKLIMVQDLVDKLRGTLVLQLVKRADLKTLYKDRPKACPHCQSNNIIGIEIMGVDEDILLWECDSCQCIYLRYDKDSTEKELQIAKSYWTNPRDWGYCPKSQFN
jgi:hypothetical protein